MHATAGTPAPEPAAARRPRRGTGRIDRRGLAALAALLVVAGALRGWYLSDEPSGKRFFDERFSLENVAVVLGHGEAPRLQAFYPSLSFLPQAAVLAASDGLHRLTGRAAFQVHDGTSYTPIAYLLVRAVAALFGLASIAMLFLVGRRLFSPAIGLLAALLFAAMPRHVYASSIFKPDGLVVLLVLVAFWWSLDALESGRRRDFWLAGCGFGLAMAAKYTAIVALGPLAVAALAGHLRDRRRWGLLVEAGIASVLTFALLNPHFATILRFLPRLWRIGQEKGMDLGITPAGVARAELDFLLANHGPVILLLALGGAAGLVAAALRRPATVPVVPLAMAATVILGGSGLWLALHLFRGLYYLPVTAFTALLAAWAAARLWRALAARAAALAGTRAAWIAGVVFAAFVLGPSSLWVYRERVPTTWRAAGELLAEVVPPPHERRSVVVAVGEGGVPFPVAPRGFLERRVAALAGEPMDDGEVFAAGSLDGAEGAALRRRMDAPGAEARRLVPVPFRLRGPEVVLLVHGWRESGRAIPRGGAPAEARVLAIPFAPPARPGELAHLEVRFRALPGVRAPTGLTVDGVRQPLQLVSRRLRRQVLRTPRFPLPAGRAEVRVGLPPRLGWPAPGQELVLWRWRPGGFPNRAKEVP